MKKICLIFLLFLVTNCYGINKNAGYSVVINIDKDAIPKTEDIKLITRYLEKTEYEVAKNKGRGAWRVESYKILLRKKKFDELKHKYIRVVVEYYFDESSNNLETLKEIEVRVGNTLEGSTPILQDEIDYVADIIIEKLTNRFGEKNLIIKRKIVTPM